MDLLTCRMRWLKSAFELDFITATALFYFFAACKKEAERLGNSPGWRENPPDFSSGDLEGKRENGLKRTQAMCS